MFDVPKLNTCCATCEYWQGPRKKTCFGVSTASNMSIGKCTQGVPSLYTSGHYAHTGNYCNKFKRWSEL